jgi:electron transfer flavoprotein alpha/beta subunit
MRILVCVKQVPEVTDVQVDPEKGTLNREGVASILNPFCEYAMDLALTLKAAHDDVEIVTLTMGPPQAKAALLRTLEMGADEAILVTDRKFAGADTWATALTIAEIVKKQGGGFDLILVGKHAIDGATAQVGPEVAEILSVPQVTYAVALELDDKRKNVIVRRETEMGYEKVRMKLPGLVSVSKGATVRAVCSFEAILAARSKPLRTLTAADIGLDAAELGLQGSPTQVVKVFPPTVKTAGERISGADPEAAAKRALAFLKENQFV